MAAVATKLKKATFKHIEAELYCYYDTLRGIEQIRKDIMYNKEVDENIGGGRSNIPSKPTERMATAIIMNKMLQQLEAITEAIRSVYERLPDEKKQLVQLKYWTKQQYSWEEIAEQLHVSKRQAIRWRNEIVYAIAEKLGWR